MKNNARSRMIILFFLYISIGTPPVFPQDELKNQTFCSDNKTIALEMYKILDKEFDKWYPRSLDIIYGGYYSDFNYKWELEGLQTKMIVTQARHIWSASNAALFYKRNETLLGIAKHGIEFLQNKMWDKEFGGFYNLVSRRGEPLEENGELFKYAYGNAFAIYGLAAYYKTSKDTAALDLAKKTFLWLEKHSYDPAYGGYFQFMQRDGTLLKNGFKANSLTWYPPKDQNSSIHLLESFTELYSVWPDSLLFVRLTQLFTIIRDRIVTEKGYMNLFFTQDWAPVSYRDSSNAVRERNFYFDHISFGHDIETAYLLLEASEVLGLKNDTTTLKIAKKMVNHSLENGWDEQNGGLYDGGYYYAGKTKPEIVRKTKEWWSQAEALNSCLMMAGIFPNDPVKYFKYFQKQWDYCKKFVIDTTYGGWYWGGTDSEPRTASGAKGSIWKGNYHTSRALINCIKMLNE